MDGVSEEDMATFLRVLERLRATPLDDPQNVAAKQALSGLVKDTKRARRMKRREATAAVDATMLAASTHGAAERKEDTVVADVPSGAPVGHLHNSRRCYCCKMPYKQVDATYHTMCPSCAAFNAARRNMRADLRGRRALLTGGRVKIGFEVALRLLRDGAIVTVTSRFPRDAVRRFAAVPDAPTWWERLDVIGIDFRDPRAVLSLCNQFLAKGMPLDILINNAAQTVRRQPWAYSPLLKGEQSPLTGLPGQPRLALMSEYHPEKLAALPSMEVFDSSKSLPSCLEARSEEQLDACGMLIDRSTANSWSARVGEINPAEVLEVQLVNAVAPFLLIDRLRPLLEASENPRRYIVNVSAVEGWFSAHFKSCRHPHTNMAKAGLNMLTHTSAFDLAQMSIFMVSVDTGWITDESPTPRRDQTAATGWRPPLDIADGAARIYDPIVRGESGDPIYGVLIKDYRVVPW